MHGDVNLCGGGRGLDAGATVPGKHSTGSVVAHKRPVRVYAFTAARGPRIYIHVRSGCRIAFSLDPVRRLQVIKLPFSCIMHRFLRKCLSDPSQPLYLSPSLPSGLYISLDPLLPLPPHPRLEFSSIAGKQGSGIPGTKLGMYCHQLYQDPLPDFLESLEERTVIAMRVSGREVKEDGMGKCMAIARGKDETAQTTQVNANRVTISTDSPFRVYL